jgi:RNA polymerase sigma factor (TIGR02999 family)
MLEKKAGKEGDPPRARPASGPETAEMATRVYDSLRSLARIYFRRERGYHTLQPTALVHEAYLRIASSETIELTGKTHFLALAATQMRRVLVEHARAANRMKRGSGRTRVTLDESMTPVSRQTVDLLALEEALTALAERNGRQARVAEMRLFAGMTMQEISIVAGVSDRTVKQDWRVARAWLAATLNDNGKDGP